MFLNKHSEITKTYNYKTMQLQNYTSAKLIYKQYNHKTM